MNLFIKTKLFFPLNRLKTKKIYYITFYEIINTKIY